MTDQFEIVTTAIISRPNPQKGARETLVLRRDLDKKRFPGRWTVPGGHLELTDFVNRPKDSEDYWYNVLEHALRREILEECGVTVGEIHYVTNLATSHHDGNVFIVSCRADYQDGDVTYQTGETIDHAWVTLSEAEGVDLIDGILDEIRLAAKDRHGWATT